MRLVLTRSGGFAGLTVRRSIETSKLPRTRARQIEALAVAAQKQRPPRDPSPDAFQYEIEIDGRRYDVSDGPGAWRSLIDGLMAAE